MVDLSEERREHLLRMVVGEGVLGADIPEHARLMYVVGGFCANDVGALKQADLDEAWNDPSLRQAAKALLNEARRRAADGWDPETELE